MNRKEEKLNENGKKSTAPDSDPKKGTELPRLEELAKSAYVMLMNTEQQRTEHYWQLGDYITELRHQLGLAHGMWQKYLEETLHIDYRAPSVPIV